jgi:hypothetical protein
VLERATISFRNLKLRTRPHNQQSLEYRTPATGDAECTADNLGIQLDFVFVLPLCYRTSISVSYYMSTNDLLFSDSFPSVSVCRGPTGSFSRRMYVFSISLLLTTAYLNSEIDILVPPLISVRRNPEANSRQSAREEEPLRSRV